MQGMVWLAGWCVASVIVGLALGCIFRRIGWEGRADYTNGDAAGAPSADDLDQPA
jgi:hypothetical protein